MKRKKLSEIAEIRFGINARTQAQGDVVCLQGKDFDEFGEIDRAGLLYVSEDQCKDTDFLQQGDVLFAAKGSRNYAVMWRGEIPRAVASSTFFVIRNLDSEVLPEYLVWYLMSARAHYFFSQNAKLGTVKTISKKVLDSLELQLHTFTDQKRIAALHRLFVAEQQRITELTEKKKTMLFNL